MKETFSKGIVDGVNKEDNNVYYIIAEGNSYSLSNYDHIALNGDSVRDNQIVSQ